MRLKRIPTAATVLSFLDVALLSNATENTPSWVYNGHAITDMD